LTSVAYKSGKWASVESCWLIWRCLHFPMKCQWMCH